MSATPARAQWIQNGVKLCDQNGGRFAIAPDAAGGAFLGWAALAGLYAQHVTVDGTLAPGWGANGNLLRSPSVLSVSPQGIVPDGTGGAILVWTDYRNAASNGYDVYALRITAAGAVAPGWPSDGIAVSAVAGDQVSPMAVPDGAGGALVVFATGQYYAVTLSARRISASGALFPAASSRPVTGASYKQEMRIVPDGLGGAIVAWEENGSEVHAQRVSPGTLVPAWGPSGVIVAPSTSAEYDLRVAPDGAGGGFVAWTDTRNGGQAQVYAQHFTAAGATAGGWDAGGDPVCGGGCGGYAPTIVSDGAGGFIASWVGAGLRAVRRAGDGTVAPGWDPAGVQIGAGGGADFDAIGDGAGGALLAWTNTFDVSSQRVTADGIVPVGWDPAGEPVTLGVRRDFYPAMALSDLGTMIVAWVENPGESYDPGPMSLWAQRVPGVGAPVAIAISLVSADATPGVARLRWFVADGANARATVYRRAADSDWAARGEAEVDGSGRVSYEDRSVASGARYAYRLGIATGGGESFSGEAWVEIPSSLALALEGARPNPAGDDLAIWFTLASQAPATLELYDLAGRRLEAREVGDLGPGGHAVSLGGTALLPPGFYLLRLTQAGRSLSARVGIVR